MEDASYRLVAVFFVTNLFLLAVGIFSVATLGVVQGLTIFLIVMVLTVYVVYRIFVLKQENKDG